MSTFITALDLKNMTAAERIKYLQVPETELLEAEFDALTLDSQDTYSYSFDEEETCQYCGQLTSFCYCYEINTLGYFEDITNYF